jgi:hypothetical protein
MKNCIKGKSCGATCIPRDRKCNKELNPEVQKAADFLANTVSLQKLAKSFRDRGFITTESHSDRVSTLVVEKTLDGNSVKLETMAYRGQKGIYFEVNVNGKFAVDESLPKAARIGLAKTMRGLILDAASRLPDGTKFWGVASGANEEHRESLIRWYGKMGFQTSGGNVSSIIRGGNLSKS